jgi:hypothetical protein
VGSLLSESKVEQKKITKEDSEVGGTRYLARPWQLKNKSPGAGGIGRGEWTSANDVFPTGSFGARELLSVLTKKMAQDSRTEAASLEVVNSLPEWIFANV